MRRSSEIMRKYNKNWRNKSQVAESAINILVDGGGFGDYPTFIFPFFANCSKKRNQKTSRTQYFLWGYRYQ